MNTKIARLDPDPAGSVIELPPGSRSIIQTYESGYGTKYLRIRNTAVFEKIMQIIVLILAKFMKRLLHIVIMPVLFLWTFNLFVTYAMFN